MILICAENNVDNTGKLCFQRGVLAQSQGLSRVSSHPTSEEWGNKELGARGQGDKGMFHAIGYNDQYLDLGEEEGRGKHS